MIVRAITDTGKHISLPIDEEDIINLNKHPAFQFEEDVVKYTHVAEWLSTGWSIYGVSNSFDELPEEWTVII